jgi:hypothetical protein
VFLTKFSYHIYSDIKKVELKKKKDVYTKTLNNLEETSLWLWNQKPQTVSWFCTTSSPSVRGDYSLRRLCQSPRSR